MTSRSCAPSLLQADMLDISLTAATIANNKARYRCGHEAGSTIGQHPLAHLGGTEAANRDTTTPKAPITVAMLNAEERPSRPAHQPASWRAAFAPPTAKDQMPQQCPTHTGTLLQRGL